MLGIFYFLINRYVFLPHIQTGPLNIVENKEGPLYFFALGDTGSGNTDQYAVAAAMEEQCKKLPKLDGILLLGDLFYMEGIHSTEDKQWEEKIEKPYGSPCLKQAPLYPIFGNHDYVGSRDAFIAYSQKNPRWKIPNRFYTVEFPNFAKIIATDSNYTDFCFNPAICSIDFLYKELNNPEDTWKIVLAHYPLLSASKKGFQHNGSGVFGWIFRHMACNKADLWLSGHAHHLEERGLPDCHTELFISGGGGGELEDIKEDPGMSFGISDHGFLQLTLSQDQLTSYFFNKNSQELYKKEIKRKNLIKN